MANYRGKRPLIRFGTSTDIPLSFGYPLDNAVTWSQPNAGARFGMADSGVEDSWVRRHEQFLAGNARWITAEVLSQIIPSTGWNDFVTQNVVLQSEAFGTTWTVAGATIGSNLDTAPDGTATADRLTETTATATTHVVQQSIVVTATVPLVFSVWAKKGTGRDWIMLRMDDGASINHVKASFNLNTGVVGTTGPNGTGVFTRAYMVAYPNGYYRCVLVGYPAPGDTTIRSQVFMAQADNSVTYDGDGSSYVTLWGAQVENDRQFASEYIPTTTATVSVTTGWRAFLQSAREKTTFRFYPDCMDRSIFKTCYLVEPMAGEPQLEIDMTRSLRLVMRTTDDSAWSGF